MQMRALCKVKVSTYEVCYLRVCSVTKSCPTLCSPVDGGKPGLPVPHHLPEFDQDHAH